MMVRITLAETPFRREPVNAARADRGTGLASKHQPMSNLMSFSAHWSKKR